MFYINYISFKNDPAKSKNVAILVSMTLAGVLIYFTYKSLINFCVGKKIEVYEYLYILLFVYLIVNVVIALKMDGESVPGEENKIVEKQETKIFEKNNQLKRTANGAIMDDFIFNKIVYYDISKERGSVIPDFGNAGLEYEEEEKQVEGQNEFNFDSSFQEPVTTHENISFDNDISEDNTTQEETLTDKSEEITLDKAAKRQLLREEIYQKSLGK